MKRWVRLASRFYPARWRRRYAAEFHAMLEQMDANWKDVGDTFKGALTMQFTSWNFKTILLAFALIGVVIAAAIASGIRQEYQSTAIIRLTTAGPSLDYLRFMYNTEQEVLSRTSLERTITTLGLYKSRLEDTPLENIVQNMRMRDISIKPLHLSAGEKGTAAFAISFAYPDPKLAQAVTRDLAAKFTAALPRAGALTSLELLDPASLPTQPFNSGRLALVFAGLCAGLTIGLAVAFAMRWRIVIVRRPA